MKKITLSVHYKTITGDEREILSTTSEADAIAAARKAAKDAKGGNLVFISWGRASDGQNGYLNPDGYAIDGKAWH